MAPPAERVDDPEGRARREEGPDAIGSQNGDASPFADRYDRLVKDLAELLETIPQVEHEPLGPAGLRIRNSPTEREVRITPLEDQGLVHFVFSHATLGTLHRAEHHASRPFGDRPPDVPKLLRQLLAFLVEGAEPRWLARRPPSGGDSAAVRETAPGPTGEPESDVLELPLD